MILDIDERVRLKEECKPTQGHPEYGTDDLRILQIDNEDMTALVKPDGFTFGEFWAKLEDLESY